MGQIVQELHTDQVVLRTQLQSALAEWRAVLRSENVLEGRDVDQRYGPNTAAVRRYIPAALLPRNASEAIAAVKIAAKHRIPLYPISTGKNWGYGCANPVRDGCALMDLSQMRRILAFDAELGTVTIEPGVTQQMLADYLDANQLRFMVPVTGAGPDASLLGNAMERGYGLTPHADHFGAVMALEAILADGRIYRSALADAGAEDVNRSFKWGIGPYLDGLFAQGNLGIVTQITIELAPIPERIEAFFFSVDGDDRLTDAVCAVREILNSVGGVTGSINLLNAQRMLSMTERCPAEHVLPGRVMPNRIVAEMAKRNQITDWTGVGALYGTAAVVRAARSKIRKVLRPFSRRVVFVTLNQVRTARKVVSWIPFLHWSYLSGLLQRAEAFLLNAGGRPSSIALPLAYWKSGKLPKLGKPFNPAHDGCGLLWYSPLIPMKPQSVREYVTMAEEICREHGMEPLITLTSLSNRCFDSTIPLLFDRANLEETARAHACLQALLKAGKARGFLPYRAGVHSMEQTVNPTSTFWQMAFAIKRAVDPQDLLAPGRYGILAAH